MGVIRIEVAGSFGTSESKEFSAQGGGHADAVAQALAWLSMELLPRSIRLDHELHGNGEKPKLGFGERRQ